MFMVKVGAGDAKNGNDKEPAGAVSCKNLIRADRRGSSAEHQSVDRGPEKKFGISAHRVTIYEDMEQLRSFGLDIYTVKSTQNKYYLAERLFDLPELKLLIDAVESSKFITAKKSQELVGKITQLSSRNKADELKAELEKGDKANSEKELGDVLFAIVNAARLYHINPDLTV